MSLLLQRIKKLKKVRKLMRKKKNKKWSSSLDVQLVSSMQNNAFGSGFSF